MLQKLEITAAWQGVALRSLSVEAWRNLWRWLIDQIGGCISVAALGDLLADALPDLPLSAYLGDLPDRRAADPASYRMLPAETEVLARGRPEGMLSVLMLGALRADELPGRVRSYFEGPTDHRERLTPSMAAPTA